MSQVISTYFPTCLLWLLSYFTMFIDTANFNNRFMGSVTFLLVLVSLRGAIVNRLPKTSHFMYIDLWFLWYITNLFLIIANHIIVDRDAGVSKQPIKMVRPTSSRIFANYKDTTTTDVTSDQKRRNLNKIAILLFPSLTICFNISYFILSG